MLDLAQLVFPDAREFRTLEEFFLNQPDEGNACGSGFQTLALQTDVAALVERLDNGSTRGRTSDAVFLHRLAEFFVVHIAPCRLHGAEQRGLGEGFGRSRLFLCERGCVRACFPLLKGR